MHDTERHAIIADEDPVCATHRNMLTKSEFRWVLGVIVGIVTTLGAACLSGFATADAVEAVRLNITDIRQDIKDEKQERKELTKETRDEIRLLRQDIKDAFRKR